MSAQEMNLFDRVRQSAAELERESALMNSAIGALESAIAELGPTVDAFVVLDGHRFGWSRVRGHWGFVFTQGESLVPFANVSREIRIVFAQAALRLVEEIVVRLDDTRSRCVEATDLLSKAIDDTDRVAGRLEP